MACFRPIDARTATIIELEMTVTVEDAFRIINFARGKVACMDSESACSSFVSISIGSLYDPVVSESSICPQEEVAKPQEGILTTHETFTFNNILDGLWEYFREEDSPAPDLVKG